MREQSLALGDVEKVVRLADRRAMLSEGVAPDHMDMEDESIFLDAIEVLNGRLEPCGADAARKALFLIQRTLSAKRLEDDVVEVYVAVWERIPADLLSTAVRETLSTETYHKVPTPGYLVAKIKPEWDRRRAQLDRLSRHVGKLKLVAMRR